MTVIHTKVNFTYPTTGFYSDPTISESTTTSYTAVFTEGIQKEFMEKYGEFQNGDCEFSFDSDAVISLNDFIETDSRKYQVKGVHERNDGNVVYQDIWCKLVQE